MELKVRFADFQTISRSLTLVEPTNITQELLEAGVKLLTKRLPSRQQLVRRLGFGVNKLHSSGKSQQTRFDQSKSSLSCFGLAPFSLLDTAFHAKTSFILDFGIRHLS